MSRAWTRLSLAIALACYCFTSHLVQSAPIATDSAFHDHKLLKEIRDHSSLNPVSSLLKEPSADDISLDFSCELCKVVSSLLEVILEGNSIEEVIARLSAEYCILRKIEDKTVCDLIVEEFKVVW